MAPKIYQIKMASDISCKNGLNKNYKKNYIQIIVYNINNSSLSFNNNYTLKIQLIFNTNDLSTYSKN
jgi:hypothetical protein